MTKTFEQVMSAFLLLRWVESVWDWEVIRPIVQHPDDAYESMDQRWNDTDRGNAKDAERNLFECHFVHHKSHMNYPGREPGLPR
jgi:hypothetical protein